MEKLGGGFVIMSSFFVGIRDLQSLQKKILKTVF